MQKYVLIHLFEPLPDGTQFSMRDWPLHVTLTPRLIVDISQPGLLDALHDRIADQDPITTTVKGDEHFGEDAHIHVAILDRAPELIMLHEDLLDLLEERGVEVDEPMYSRHGYRPHVTVQKSGRVHRGDTITIDSLTLVDMFPDGDISQRRVMRTFQFKKPPVITKKKRR